MDVPGAVEPAILKQASWLAGSESPSKIAVILIT